MKVPGNQIHNFISSSGSGTVIYYGSGSYVSGSYGSGSGSTTLFATLKIRKQRTEPWGFSCVWFVTNISAFWLFLNR